MADNIPFLKEDADTIHQRMIDKAPSNVSIMEGDFFWAATRPVAEELAQLIQLRLDNVISVPFSQTSYGKYLDLIGEGRGVFRKQAVESAGVIKVIGEPGTSIEKGKLASTIATESKKGVEFEFLETKVIDNTRITYVNAKCTQVGTVGNVSIGSITLLATPINGVESILNEEEFKDGTNIEDDEEYRERIITEMQKVPTSGNKYNYISWAMEVAGVGYVKAYPRWNGVNSIKLVLLSSNKTAVSDTKIQEVADHIEDNRPIGADVTVESAIEKSIDIAVKITLSNNGTIESALADIQKNIKQYFYDITFNENIVRYTKIGEVILNSSNIIDYENLKINNLIGNIQLEDNEFPTLGAIQLI